MLLLVLLLQGHRRPVRGMSSTPRPPSLSMWTGCPGPRRPAGGFPVRYSWLPCSPSRHLRFSTPYWPTGWQKPTKLTKRYLFFLKKYIYKKKNKNHILIWSVLKNRWKLQCQKVTKARSCWQVFFVLNIKLSFCLDPVPSKDTVRHTADVQRVNVANLSLLSFKSPAVALG